MSGERKAAMPPRAKLVSILSKSHDACLSSCNQVWDYFRGNHSRQFLFQALELECKPLVVHPEQAENSSIEIPHVHRIPHDVVAEVVGLTVDVAGFCTAARHPRSKTARMVVAAVVVFRK